ncbi:MAG: hypothetical protein ACI379_14435 [Nocardioides sp.]|uniref:hypothetical protein n=1 Tax=Nocardioides sp. TaxID=35761 RepID=UPI003F09FFE1
MKRFERTRAVLGAELEAVRRRDPDLDAGDVTAFTLPLLGWASLIALVGVLPIVVIRMGDGADELLIPLIASVALAVICSAVVTWVTATVISAFVTVALYRKPAKGASKLVVRTTIDSFDRINNSTSTLMLLALVAGLVALAVGLPARKGADAAHSVVEDLLTSQVAVLFVGLAILFLAEACRTAADIIDDQSPALAWPWALVIVGAAWAVATVAGPLEFTTMVRRLLEEWLPATVGDRPRAEAINDLLPRWTRWLAAFGSLPVIAAIWWVEAWRNDGLAALRHAPTLEVSRPGPEPDPGPGPAPRG